MSRAGSPLEEVDSGLPMSNAEGFTQLLTSRLSGSQQNEARIVRVLIT